MTKVFIYPTNSLILADLVKRFGHEPLVVMNQVREKVTSISVDSPPLNITPEDPKFGLKYAAIEVPAGVRGRMSIIGPMLEQAEAGIIVENPPADFGCVGCNRTNELTKYLVRIMDIPVLEIKYPESEDYAKDFVYSIADFLKSLESDSKEELAEENKEETGTSGSSAGSISGSGSIEEGSSDE